VKYIFLYHGGKMPDTPEDGKKMMADWRTWMDSAGDSLADAGNPVGPSKTVSSTEVKNDGGANPMSGYSLVDVDDMEAAIALAKSCPHTSHGTIEVAELMDMSGCE